MRDRSTREEVLAAQVADAPSPAGALAAIAAHALEGRTVVGPDGRRTGRVRDIYLLDRTGELAAVTIEMGHLRPRGVVVPVELLSMDEDGRLRVSVDAEGLRAGLPAPVHGYLDGAALARMRSAVTSALR